MATRRVVLEGSQAALVVAVVEEQQRVAAELQQRIAVRLAPIRREHQIADGVEVRFGMDGDKAVMEITEPAAANGNGRAVIPPVVAGRIRKRSPTP